MIDIEVTINSKVEGQSFGEMAVVLELNARRISMQIARYIAGEAKDLAPVDTGELRDSIIAYKGDGDEWIVLVVAAYGLYVDHGTRYMRAQPFFTPAVEMGRRMFQEMTKNIFRKAV